MTKQFYLKGLFVLFLALLITTSVFAQKIGQKKRHKVTAKKAKMLADSLQTINLDAVKVTATRVLFVTKKDTTTYNLDALTLKAGAMLGEALKKLPNMEVKNGKLFYQGQPVNRLLINGIDFAKDDPSKALNALPAYVVGKVKAFNQKTEASRLAGYDNGSRDIIVDVLLKKKYLGTWTGEAEVGGGTKKYYLAKGFANTFTDRFRVSLFANANNINQQLWYNGSGRAVNGYKGIFGGQNEFLAPGATFFWKTKAEKGKKGYLIIEGNTDFNREEGHTISNSEEEKYLGEGTLYKADRRIYQPLEYRWAGHLSFEWCPTDDLVITYKPNLEIKKTTTDVSFLYAKWNKNPFKEGVSTLDLLEQNSSTWIKEHKPVYFEKNPKKHFTDIIPAWHEFYIRQNLKSQGTLSLKHYLRLDGHKSELYELDYYDYFTQGKKNDLINRYSDEDKTQLHHSTKLNFSQQIKDVRLNLSYSYAYVNRNRDDNGYRLDRLNTLYSTYLEAFDLFGELPQNFNEVKSSIVDNETTIYEDESVNIHTINTAMNYKKGDYYFNLDPWLAYRSEHLDHEKGTYKPFHIERDEWLPGVDVQTGFNSSKNGRLRLIYTYTIDQPQLYQSITIPDLSNPKYITLANPNLKNNHKHYIYFSYSKQFKGKIKGKDFLPSIDLGTRLSYSEDKLSNKVAYNAKTGVTTVMPVNIGETYGWSSKLNVETPLDLKQRLFFDLDFSYDKSESKHYGIVGDLADAKLNNSSKEHYRLELGPKLRLSKFNASLRYAFDYVSYSNADITMKRPNTKEHILYGDLSWNLPFEINLSSNLYYIHYSGSENKIYQEDMALLNCTLDIAFLKDKSLTLFFKAKDILDQNKNFYQYFDAESRTIRRLSGNNLGRYFMLGLKYRFSTKKKTQAPKKDAMAEFMDLIGS